MKKNMTKSQLEAYVEGWKRINAFELKELQNTTPAQKFRQLVVLMSSAFLFGTHVLKLRENRMVRERWQLLRKEWRRAPH